MGLLIGLVAPLFVALVALPMLLYFLYRWFGWYLTETILFATDVRTRRRRHEVALGNAETMSEGTPRIAAFASHVVVLNITEVLTQVCGTVPVFRAGDDLRQKLLLSTDDIESLLVHCSQHLNLWWPTVRDASRAHPPKTVSDVVLLLENAIRSKR